MAAPKHILLVSYVFPPYYGIGGRRWAKHASELTKLGYIIHVICARNPFDEKSLWWDLVKDNPNIRIYELSRMYPKVLVKFDHDFLQKILYKFWATLLPFITKGSSLDRTIFWRKTMLRKAKKLIVKHQINHVICSGGPFGAMYQVTELRKWFNNLFILNDMRDPWTWGPNWGFPNLEPKKKAYELMLEEKTMERSDIISVPNDEMKNYLTAQYPQYTNKIHIIPHFYDEEELCVLPKKQSSTIRMVMYGNIYNGIEDILSETARTLVKHPNISLDIYTDKKKHAHMFQEYGTNTRFYDLIPAKALFEKFGEYDYVLLIHPKYGINNISTKFFEIIYTRTPVILLCDDGRGPQFIRNNNLGLHADINKIDSLFQQIATGNTNLKYNNLYDISQYSIKKITKDIASLLDRSAPYQTHVPETKLKKDILLTFDYELFLGAKSGTVDKCIIEPTDIMLEVLEKHQITKALFFVDTTYIKRLIDNGSEQCIADYLKIEAQLFDILKKGHYIFPHLHPHWIDAKYIEPLNQWDLSDTSKYRFHNINPDLREELFDFSVSFIEKIQSKVQIRYDINSYRAGGWCLQPFEDFRPMFEKHHITNDFSAINGFENPSPNTYYNYMNMPTRRIFNFRHQVEIEDHNGPFREYSISNIKKNNKTLSRILLKYLSLTNIDNFGDGSSTIKISSPVDETSETTKEKSPSINYEMASIELLNITTLKAYKTYLFYNSYCHFISHPKMLNTHNIKCFDMLLTHLKRKYILQTDYELMN